MTLKSDLSQHGDGTEGTLNFHQSYMIIQGLIQGVDAMASHPSFHLQFAKYT